MWQPRQTDRTRNDVPDESSAEGPSTPRLAAVFLGLMLIVAVAGYVVARTGAVIAAETGLGGSVVGALFTATATSLPELVTTIAAVRRGALQLAVGGIIGGNMFDVLFLSASDAAYRGGSIYHAIDDSARFWALVAILMTGVLLLGLIRREKRGFATIGLESVTLLALYAAAAGIAAFVLR
jgi:cation:H+ antiporter